MRFVKNHPNPGQPTPLLTLRIRYAYATLVILRRFDRVASLAHVDFKPGNNNLRNLVTSERWAKLGVAVGV